MASIPLNWRTNLRANLVLWPDVAPNIASLVKQDGAIYNETALLGAMAGAPGEKVPGDTRSVRNTIEILALAGLAYKSEENQPRLCLTPLGRATFSFLGVIGSKRFANEANRSIIGEALARGLSIVVEYQAIWRLMRKTGDLLSNEELNRAMGGIRYLDDIDAVARRVLQSREQNNPTIIGPRLYEDDKYADGTKRNDQRKAMNPIFLLAGGGWILMSSDANDDYRRLETWAIPCIERQINETVLLRHAGTEPSAALQMSDYACVPTV